MNTTTNKLTAADEVADIATNQIESIRFLLCPEQDDVDLELTAEGATLSIDGDMITVEVSADDVEACKDSDGEVDKDDLVGENWQTLCEQASERFHEYGLSFDYYVRQDDDGEDSESESHWTYLISTGGPGTEIRFFAGDDLMLTRAEFWYLPWFDGACVTVTKDPTVQALWDFFAECGADHVRASSGAPWADQDY